jgi:hypothetical protein
MKRTVFAVIGGLVAWTVIVSLINRGIRLALPGYAEAEPELAFTLPMMIARLAMAAITSLAAGAIVRAIAPASRPAPWIVGLVIAGLFLPAHIQIWSRLPLWYHLFFLVTLAPFVALGAWLSGKRERPQPMLPDRR